MTETLQDKIDYFTITARQMGSDYYWSSIEPQINKAIQELREEIRKHSHDYFIGDKYSAGMVRAYQHVLSLIGEKK